MEKELAKAFEETTTRNVKAILDHSNESRRLVREMQEKHALLERILAEQDKTLEMFKKQLANLQAKMYLEGTQ